MKIAKARGLLGEAAKDMSDKEVQTVINYLSAIIHRAIDTVVYPERKV